MKYSELIEYQTKAGDEVEFRYNEDAEGDNNRGWTVDEIRAYVNNQYAGYIALSYIPKDRFIRYYPTVLNYMSMIGGSHPLPLDKQDVHYKNLNNDELKTTIQQVSYRSHKYYDYWNDKNSIPESRKEMLIILEDIINNELKDDKKNFKKFVKYHVDKPIVDYIRVFEEGDRRDNRRSLTRGEELTPAEQNFQRQHIGLALYYEAGDWLKKKGLRLYASDTQTDEAQAAWQKLEQLGKVGKTNGRRWLKV